MTINGPPPLAAGIAGGILGGVAKSIGGAMGGVARSDHTHFTPSGGRPTLDTLEEGDVRMDGVDDNIRSMEDYVPESVASLVSGTPADELQRAMEDLKRATVVKNGHRLPPLPRELYWVSGSEINSMILYALTKQVVEMELERFARRLERYYYLVPKTNDETITSGAVEAVPNTSEAPAEH